MEPQEVYTFRIFITGDSARSVRAVKNLRALSSIEIGDGAEIEVVDVLASPARAEQEKVIATPMVLRLSPLPARRVIGDLANFDLAAAALGLPGDGLPAVKGAQDD